MHQSPGLPGQITITTQRTIPNQRQQQGGKPDPVRHAVPNRAGFSPGSWVDGTTRQAMAFLGSGATWLKSSDTGSLLDQFSIAASCFCSSGATSGNRMPFEPAASTADAMNVVFRRIRQIVIDHERQLINIQDRRATSVATRIESPFLEFGQRRQPLLLFSRRESRRRKNRRGSDRGQLLLRRGGYCRK